VRIFIGADDIVELIHVKLFYRIVLPCRKLQLRDVSKDNRAVDVVGKTLLTVITKFSRLYKRYS